jgi:glycosyltransferase XagB
VSKHSRPAQARRHGRVEKSVDPSAFAIARAARDARETLYALNPSFSAKSAAGRVMIGLILAFVLTAVLASFGFGALNWAWQASIWLFAIIGLLRALACFVPLAKPEPLAPSRQLEVSPLWSILIALYDEADSVPPLLEALSKLDWAPDQLDIIFACERDDEATIAALKTQQGRYNFRIVRVPNGGPRTKPNALQTALPFVRGRFVTVYDAEDRPDPAQLRAAFHAFITGPSNLAVVQAPLVTWNHNESWIARQFALDYAIWFRVILPALCRISNIVPLGGTSNHFRTDILRQTGGWDPYNVTEDADLGIRLGRFGYVAGLIAPPTSEEAPPRIGAWVKQRGRWIQGHIQTFSVHLRQPIALTKALKLRGLLGFFLGLAIGPMSAAFALPMLVSLIAVIILNAGRYIEPQIALFIALGLAGHWLTCIIASCRDGRFSLLTACLTLPLYHCLQTFSACRAFWRVVFTPAVWDKTDHGRAARKRVNGRK